jgi:hypothetical protein
LSFAWIMGAAAAAVAAAPTPAPRPVAYATMEGTWTVDLRVSLDDAPYTQPMILQIAADRTVTGSFYNSDILAGRAGTAQGRSCVAFRTTDGQGLYQTSACLVGDKMVGLTWAEGRNFVLPWTAGKN